MLWRLTWAWGPVFNMWMSGPVFARACRKSRKQALAAQFDADVDDFLRENEQLKDKAGECWRYRDISFPFFPSITQKAFRFSKSPQSLPPSSKENFLIPRLPIPSLILKLKQKGLLPACHACHAESTSMSPSATPAMQNAHRCRQVARLPRITQVDVAKRHACHTKQLCVCVCKLCVRRRAAGGGGGADGGRRECTAKNKNPTQRCGEKNKMQPTNPNAVT